MRPSVDAFDAWMARHPVAYATLIAIATCLVLALFVDLPLLVFLQREAWVAMRPAFSVIGWLGRVHGYLAIALLLYVAALAMAARETQPPRSERYRRIARHCLLYFASLVASTAAIQLMKTGIARMRPHSYFTEGSYGLGPPLSGFPWDSFPSGHTQVAFVAAAVLALLAPRWAPLIYLVAGLVAFARLVTGWHYLSDVVASGFIAVVAVRLLARIFLDPGRAWPGQSPLAWVRGPRAR